MCIPEVLWNTGHKNYEKWDSEQTCCSKVIHILITSNKIREITCFHVDNQKKKLFQFLSFASRKAELLLKNRIIYTSHLTALGKVCYK